MCCAIGDAIFICSLGQVFEGAGLNGATPVGVVCPLRKVPQWGMVHMIKTLITIVETNAYLNRAKGRLAQQERDDIKITVAEDPECGALIQGTGGVRKVRFGTSGRGKSGGVRVVYYYYNETIPVFLLTVFAKNEKDSLTKRERNDLAKLVEQLKRTYGG